MSERIITHDDYVRELHARIDSVVAAMRAQERRTEERADRLAHRLDAIEMARKAIRYSDTPCEEQIANLQDTVRKLRGELNGAHNEMARLHGLFFRSRDLMAELMKRIDAAKP